ncbi:glycogen debranching protein GlgX [Arcanobacterium hippocoleae]|uniref:Glycogen operon protein n=1 Tax=Arcanobacterium hippocoleae TaxID=149017 RepID=A0ABU1T0C2_9ACTO|nr:glycogen debranching protein GlgX [Arcanobacterium hippocoleae]MDR6938829.1 glycogen operon protein [Arcanobacterium hippocoleae]
MEIWPGKPYPLGATFDGAGTNFAVFSSAAQKIELCLIDDNYHEERIEMREIDAHVWHCYVLGIRPGQRYGFRAHGEFNPEAGLRFDASKILLDPYAKAIDGQVENSQANFSYNFTNPEEFVNEDSLGQTMLSVVHNQFFDWGHDRPPHHQYHDTIIYEAHVKGMTKLNSHIPEQLRGTYMGIAHPANIEYLKELGVTAIELMPVHQFVNDTSLIEKGLSNYWGYNTIGFFAPQNTYSSSGTRGEQVEEFKSMVKALHEANIEVILDVVYNHTAEGNHLGPTLSFRGLDNAAYYRLVPDDSSHYFDTTGTGNSLNMRAPHTLQLIMDSLRYWILEMHVDGFRFDLASTLARELHAVDKLSTFFDIIQQDPIISQVKLIAEPWDVGEGGYNVGEFPPLWTEWNGKYRDTMRDFWRGEPSTLDEFASRLSGSSDLYAHSGRRPVASINFITAHDGFTMRDLVSYNEKHNEANGEDSRDGESHNRSWNCGVEGPTDDSEIRTLRVRQVKNMLATLLLSQGVPMISHGDEIGRTQQGNNNTYAQDNELAWMDWELHPEATDLFLFTQKLIQLRKDHPVFRRRRFFQGESSRGGTSLQGDIEWMRNDSSLMEDADWETHYARSLMVYLNGQKIAEPNLRGEKIIDDDFLLAFNASAEDLQFVIPQTDNPTPWEVVLCTDSEIEIGAQLISEASFLVRSRSIWVLQRKIAILEEESLLDSITAESQRRERGSESGIEPFEDHPQQTSEDSSAVSISTQ